MMKKIIAINLAFMTMAVGGEMSFPESVVDTSISTTIQSKAMQLVEYNLDIKVSHNEQWKVCDIENKLKNNQCLMKRYRERFYETKEKLFKIYSTSLELNDVPDSMAISLNSLKGIMSLIANQIYKHIHEYDSILR